MTPSPQPHRGGLSLLSALLMFLLLLLTVALAWGSYANRYEDYSGDGTADGFTLQITNPRWWAVAFGAASDLIDSTRPFVESVREDLWGEGGLLDDARDWLDQRRSPPAPDEAEATGQLDTSAATEESPVEPRSDASPSSSTGPRQPRMQTVKPVTSREVEIIQVDPDDRQASMGRSPRILRLEQRFSYIEEHFSEGIAHYERANPGQQAWDSDRLAEARQARTYFVKVRDDLNAWLDDYRALPEHDPAMIARAERLLQLNQRLLANAHRMTGTR